MSLPPVDLQLVDENEVPYHTLWPQTTVKKFAESFVSSFVSNHDTYVIFDCYHEKSIKSHERKRRSKGAVVRAFTLRKETVLPAKDCMMKSDANKKALIKFLCSTECENLWDTSLDWRRLSLYA